jgi:hypothetical protein
MMEGREELRNPQDALGLRSKPATNAEHRCPSSSLRLEQAWEQVGGAASRPRKGECCSAGGGRICASRPIECT